MANSRRSFLGLGGALAGLVVASKVKAEPEVKPLAPAKLRPVVGQIMPFFHRESRLSPAMGSSGYVEAVAVIKYKVWSGSEWLDLDTHTGWGY